MASVPPEVLNLGNEHARNQLLVVLHKLTPPALPWASMYWIFAVFTLAMVAVLVFSRFPRVERAADERAGSVEMYGSLFRKPMVWAFFLCVFAYVGSEQGTADWISKFLSQYHGYDPHTTGATALSWFWGLLTAGCFIGMLLLRIFDSRPDRHLPGSPLVLDRSLVWSGECFSHCFPRDWSFRIRDVAHSGFVGAQFSF